MNDLEAIVAAPVQAITRVCLCHERRSGEPHTPLCAFAYRARVIVAIARVKNLNPSLASTTGGLVTPMVDQSSEGERLVLLATAPVDARPCPVDASAGRETTPKGPA